MKGEIIKENVKHWIQIQALQDSGLSLWFRNKLELILYFFEDFRWQKSNQASNLYFFREP